MASTLRFGAGTAEAPMSGVWHLAIHRADVYLGASASSMGFMKFSLHASGVWVLAATQQSKATFEGGNRRAKRWTRPAEHSPGWTRGPGIVVPHIAWPKRPLVTSSKKIVWVPGPLPGHLLEFSLYFAAPDAPTPVWLSGQTMVGERDLKGGGRVVALSSYRQMSAVFESNVEWMVATTVIGADPEKLIEGSFLWVTESRDRLKVPLVVDLPANVAVQNPNAVIASADPLAVRPAKPSTLDQWRESLKKLR